jgi:hypothetical protein
VSIAYIEIPNEGVDKRLDPHGIRVGGGVLVLADRAFITGGDR